MFLNSFYVFELPDLFVDDIVLDYCSLALSCWICRCDYWTCPYLFVLLDCVVATFVFGVLFSCAMLLDFLL